MSSGRTTNRLGYRLAVVSVFAAAIGVTPVYADATVEGVVFQNSLLFDTGPQTGSSFSDILTPWSYTRSSCVSYGKGDDAAKKTGAIDSIPVIRHDAERSGGNPACVKEGSNDFQTVLFCCFGIACDTSSAGTTLITQEKP